LRQGAKPEPNQIDRAQLLARLDDSLGAAFKQQAAPRSSC
jgi:hypothetical protein